MKLGGEVVWLVPDATAHAAQSVAGADGVQADLLLPRTHHLDDSGTVVATDGRVCELRCSARGRPANWELLRDLAEGRGDACGGRCRERA